MQQPVRSWRFAPRAEPWTDRNAFVDLDDEKLQAIETSALASIPVRSRGPFIDFAAYHGPKTTDAAGYVAREIRTSEPRTLRILAGSDDALRVWINRKLVHSNLILRTAVPDEDSFEARLEPGASTLLVEVSETTGGWGLYLRMEDERGQGLILEDDGALEPAR